MYEHYIVHIYLFHCKQLLFSVVNLLPFLSLLDFESFNRQILRFSGSHILKVVISDRPLQKKIKLRQIIRHISHALRKCINRLYYITSHPVFRIRSSWSILLLCDGSSVDPRSFSWGWPETSWLPAASSTSEQKDKYQMCNLFCDIVWNDATKRTVRTYASVVFVVLPP